MLKKIGEHFSANEGATRELGLKLEIAVLYRLRHVTLAPIPSFPVRQRSSRRPLPGPQLSIARYLWPTSYICSPGPGHHTVCNSFWPCSIFNVIDELKEFSSFKQHCKPARRRHCNLCPTRSSTSERMATTPEETTWQYPRRQLQPGTGWITFMGSSVRSSFDRK